ncbi:MAG: hypothetical protein WC735_04680 [Candidatus Paceibacterota bacterium]|jgi:hypothetical protein
MSEPLDITLMIDKMIRSVIIELWFFAKEQLLIYWPYVFGFFIFVVAGVVLQIIMLRSGGHSKLSAGFNRLVGSLTYFIFFLIFFSISYWVFGSQVVDSIWFAVFGALSFPTTGLFLRAIGFWYY